MKRRLVSASRAMLRAGLPPWIILTVGCLFSITAFLVIHRLESDRAATSFDRRVQILMQVFDDMIEQQASVLVATRLFFNASDEVNRREFSTFANGVMVQHAELLSLTWLPYVRDDERAALEDAAHADGLPGFMIRDYHSTGAFARAGSREAYCPILYASSRYDGTALLGVDMLSDPVRRALLQRACDAGTVVLSSPLRLIQVTNQSPGVLMAVAVYHTADVPATTEARRQQLVGYLVAAFAVHDIVKRCVSQHVPLNAFLHIRDVTVQGADNWLYQGNPWASGTHTVATPLRKLARLTTSQRIRVADRTWEFDCTDTSPHTPLSELHTSWIVLLVGILTTALLSQHQQQILGHTRALALGNERLRTEINEHARTQQILTANERRYSTLFDVSPSGILLEAADGTIIDVNAAVCASLGYPRDELIGRNIRILAPPDEHERIDNHIRAILAGTTLHHVVKNLHKDGTVRAMELREAKITQPDGRDSVIVVSNDITERMEAEARLRSSEAKNRAMLSAIPDAVFRLRRDGTCVDYHKPDDAIILMPEELPAWHHAKLLALIDATLSAGALQREEFNVPVNGEQRSYEARMVVSGVDEVLTVLRDITQDKRMRRAAAESQSRLQALFSNAQEAIIFADDNGRCVDANPAAGDLTGRTRAEIIGALFWDVAPSTMHSDGEKFWRRFLRAGRHSGTYELRRKDGVALQIEYCDVANVLPGLHLSILRDITVRRQLEIETERVEQLESLGLLAGGIAHDFNNILTVILGNISLAQMTDGVPEACVTLLLKAEAGALRARDLTQQLLTFAKGGTPVKRTASLIDIVRESAAFAVHGSTSRCIFDLAEDTWHAEVDSGQISQVVRNLTLNADQSMPHGGTITISTRNIQLAGGTLPLPSGLYVEVAVSDRGSGISPQHLDHIFDPYFTTKHKGSGLGLATSFSIIKKHNGHITVEARGGGGTTFRVYLPALGRHLDNRTPSAVARQPLRTARVLIMDDEEPIRALLASLLQQLGWYVELAKDGEEAILRFSAAQQDNTPFDLVILDLTIPGGIGGKDTLTALRASDPHIKAIVTSGYSNDPIMANHREHGFDGVITKPFRYADVIAILDDVLSDRVV